LEGIQQSEAEKDEQNKERPLDHRGKGKQLSNFEQQSGLHKFAPI
jgi:hypothetical protein